MFTRFQKIHFSWISVIIVSVMILTVVGCLPTNLSAQERITLVMPPWASFPKDLLGEFEKDTGIKVNLVTKGWEELYDAIVVGCAAGEPPGDVLEFDWSWTGEFGATGWFVPLTDRISEEAQAEIPDIKSFMYKGDILAVPFSNDFRLAAANMKNLNQIGYSSVPESLSEVTAVSLALKAANLDEYPLVFSLCETTYTATDWFLMTLAHGQGLFDKNMDPLFSKSNSAGMKALRYMVDHVRKYEVVSPALFTVPMVGEAFQAGRGSILLHCGPGSVINFLNPELSQIHDVVQFGLYPGANGTRSATYSLVEGMAIPKKSKHKEAAWKFLQWIMEPETQKKLFLSLGLFPSNPKVIRELAASGQLPFGNVLAEQQEYMNVLFPAGCPLWFAEFQEEAGALVFEAARGEITVEKGLVELVKEVETWRKE